MPIELAKFNLSVNCKIHSMRENLFQLQEPEVKLDYSRQLEIIYGIVLNPKLISRADSRIY